MELSPIESNLFGIVLELVADVRVSFLFDLGDNSTGDGFNFIVVGALFVIPVSICKAFFFNGPVDAVDDFNAMGLGFVATGVDFDGGGVDPVDPVDLVDPVDPVDPVDDFNAMGLGFVATGAGIAFVATFLGADFEVLVFIVPFWTFLFVPLCWLVGSMVVIVNTRGNFPLLLSWYCCKILRPCCC